MDRGAGVVIITIGAVIVLIGILVASGGLSWFGRLPGDVRFESGSGRIFIPFTSAILVSVVLTILVNVILRLLR